MQKTKMTNLLLKAALSLNKTARIPPPTVGRLISGGNALVVQTREDMAAVAPKVPMNKAEPRDTIDIISGAGVCLLLVHQL